MCFVSATFIARRKLARIAAPVAILLALPVASRHAGAQPGTIQGDVYLATNAGTVRRFAASRVYLIPLPTVARLADPTCAGPETVLSTIQRETFAATGMAAHYAFQSVPAGRYLLYSDTPMGYFWLVPVSVASQGLTLDLDNNNVTLVRYSKQDELADAVCAFAPRQPDAAPTTPPRVTNAQDVSRLLSRLYPSSLKTLGISGHVVVRMDVQADGRPDPTTIRIVNGTGLEFDDVATRVASEIRFEPARRNGAPVRYSVTLPLDFNAQ